MYDPGTLYEDPILTNFSVGYKDQRLHGLDLFPETSVTSKSGRYRVFDRSDWLIWKSRREPGTVANEISGAKWSEDQFGTVQHSLQAPIYDEERQTLNGAGGFANAGVGGALSINPERDATRLVTRSLMLEHELRVATEIGDVTNYPAGHVVTLTSGGTGTRWSNYAASGGVYYSDPIGDLRTAVQRIYLDTGQWPTDMTIPFDAVGVIESHPDVRARFENWSLAGMEAWKLLLGLPTEATNFRVHVLQSKYNAADNVDVAESIQSFWGTDVGLFVIDPTMGQDTVTFAKTFSRLFPNGTLRPTDRWREENRKADLVRTSWEWDVKVVSGYAGYLFKTAVDAIV